MSVRSNDTLEFRKKFRPLRVRLVDGSTKTIMIDETKTVAELTEAICGRIGITNCDEYSLCFDTPVPTTPVSPNKFMTLRKLKESPTKARDGFIDGNTY